MSFVTNWLRPSIKNLKPYQVVKTENMIKLDAMESPFIMPQILNKKYPSMLANAKINLYPDACAHKLKQTLISLMDIPSKLETLLGNGSDELIQLLLLACEKNSTILSFKPSFAMYKIIATFNCLNYKEVNLDKNFDINLKNTLKAIKKYKPKLIFIAYPNNPTANKFNKESIISIIKNTNALVVVDEAYYAYTNDSFLKYISKYRNLIVLRTISKIGFAGLRLGILIGSKTTIYHLNKLRLPYNINILTQISANFLLQNKETIIKNSNIIIAMRTKLIADLSSINQLKVYPSTTNFILFATNNAQLLFNELKNQRVLVKKFTKIAILKNYLRVTVGNLQENKIFINIVKNYYAQQ